MLKTYTSYLYCPMVLRPLLPIPWQNKKPAGSSSIAIKDEPAFAFGERPCPSWAVLCFTEDDLNHRLEKSTALIYDTIDHYGGYEVLNEPDTFQYVKRGTQLRLDF